MIQTDDTPLLDPKLGRMRTGRIWTYVGDGAHPYAVYNYTRTRGRDGPEAFLDQFRGYLQADAYSGYDELYKDPYREVTEVACGAQSRRKHYEAQSSDLMCSTVMLVCIRLLYDVERESRDQKLDSEAHLALRQAKSKPILEDIHAYLEREQPQVLPKSRKDKRWPTPCRTGRRTRAIVRMATWRSITTGAKRSLRGIAVRRRNWTFLGSDDGGRTAAVLNSLIATCKRLAIAPFAFLRDVFTRISDHPQNRLAELIPDQWKAAQAGLIAEG